MSFHIQILNTLKKNIDIDLLELMQDSDIEDAVIDAFKDEATKCSLEMDKMWSYCHDKKHQEWLWWAIDHETGVPIAFCFGTRECKVLDELLMLLSKPKEQTSYWKA